MFMYYIDIMGSANFMEMQQRMQRDLMSNPDMLRQVNWAIDTYSALGTGDEVYTILGESSVHH